MPTRDPKSPRLAAATIAAAGEFPFHHPLNPASEVRFKALGEGQTLSEAVGMKRIAVHLARIPPGKESFAYHCHLAEEEFLYVLAGRAVAELDGEEVELGPGDFLGFAAPSVAHHLRNPFAEDFVCLMGGERREIEIADFPRLRKRMIRTPGQGQVVDWDQLTTIWKEE